MESWPMCSERNKGSVFNTTHHVLMESSAFASAVPSLAYEKIESTQFKAPT